MMKDHGHPPINDFSLMKNIKNNFHDLNVQPFNKIKTNGFKANQRKPRIAHNKQSSPPFILFLNEVKSPLL